MKKYRLRQICLHAMLVVGILVVIPFMGYAVSIATGPSAERRVETRGPSDRLERNNVSRSGFISTAGVTYRPYYSNYPYSPSCNGNCEGPTYKSPFYQSDVGQYQNYYMYNNFNYGWP